MKKQIDLDEVVQRNREFSRLTPISYMLTELDILLKVKEDTLLKALYGAAVGETGFYIDSFELTDWTRKQIIECASLRSFLSRIKTKYNTIPGRNIEIGDFENEEMISDLEKELKSVLEDVKSHQKGSTVSY